MRLPEGTNSPESSVSTLAKGPTSPIATCTPSVPPYAAACTTITNYTFQPGKLSVGSDIDLQQSGKSPQQLAAHCNTDPACKGFTSSGWLKSSIKLPALWMNWSTSALAGPCDGMFVKNDVEYEGELHAWQLGLQGRCHMALAPALKLVS